MRVHASPSQPSDQESAGDKECPSAAVGGLPPGSILEEMETLLNYLFNCRALRFRRRHMPSRTKDRFEGAFPKGVAKPALRALASIGVTRLDQVTRFTEAELLALHGMGPKAIEIIKASLLEQGKSLAKDK
jgi:hypothetical protein